MRITKVELKNFKRFTDLTIDGIPPDAKLVLLIGSNGAGKSSVFDAFESMNRGIREESLSEAEYNFHESYLRKDQSKPNEVLISVLDNRDYAE